MELQLPKGMRDFPPEEKILRDKVINKLIKVFERYGFNPLETPIVERLDVLTAKYGASDETDVMKEVYRFKDQGDRDLGLRFELTLSTARFVGMDPTLKMPFKRYQIGNVFRDGPIKLGRYREFTQCDVDIFGVKQMTADAELIQLLFDGFKELNIDAVVQVNNRKLLNGLIQACGIPEDKSDTVIITIDKIEKQPIDEIKKELASKGIGDDAITKLISLFQMSGSNADKIKTVEQFLEGEPEDSIGIIGLTELKEVLLLVNNQNLIFNPALARGLAYYTGTVFEGFFKNGRVKSSICGGGRYDSLVGTLLDGKKDLPAVGVAFGLEPITEELKLGSSMEKTVVKLFVIPIKCYDKVLPLVQRLRDAGIKTAIDLQGKGISKNLDYANVLDIPYVLIVGQRELDEGKVKLKDMRTGEEFLLTLEELEQKLV